MIGMSFHAKVADVVVMQKGIHLLSVFFPTGQSEDLSLGTIWTWKPLIGLHQSQPARRSDLRFFHAHQDVPPRVEHPLFSKAGHIFTRHADPNEKLCVKLG